MSGNVGDLKSDRGRSGTDRRVVRTRDTLGDALLELMQEKAFDGITVQEVLDRAGVGRSTFYAHYRDKDDLFLSDVEEFLEMMGTYLTRRGAAAERIVPVKEMLEHISGQKELLKAMKAAGKLQDVMELWRGIFARSIEERLRRAGGRMDGVELSVCAAGLSGSFIGMVEWWIDQGSGASAETLDAMFHRMCLRGSCADGGDLSSIGMG